MDSLDEKDMSKRSSVKLSTLGSGAEMETSSASGSGLSGEAVSGVCASVKDAFGAVVTEEIVSVEVSVGAGASGEVAVGAGAS